MNNTTGPVEFSSEWGCQREGLFAGVSQWFLQLISRAAEVDFGNVVRWKLAWIWLVATDVTGIVLIFWSHENAESSLQCSGSRETVVSSIIPELQPVDVWCECSKSFPRWHLLQNVYTCDLPLPKPLSLTLRWVYIQNCCLPVRGEHLSMQWVLFSIGNAVGLLDSSSLGHVIGDSWRE